jgi:hypothetical protein
MVPGAAGLKLSRAMRKRKVESRKRKVVSREARHLFPGKKRNEWRVGDFILQIFDCRTAPAPSDLGRAPKWRGVPAKPS